MGLMPHEHVENILILGITYTRLEECGVKQFRRNVGQQILI